MCHFASYIIMLFQKVIIYDISAVGEEGLLAYCDLMSVEIYPGIQFRLPCTPPRTIFHECQIVHWDPLDGKRRCPQKNFGLGYVKWHGFYANP